MAFPMIGTVALSMVMPLQKAVAVLAIPTLIINLLTFFKRDDEQQSVQYKSDLKKTFFRETYSQEIGRYLQQYWLLVVTSLIGSVLGVKLLLILPVAYLYLSISLVTLYYAIHGWLSLIGKVKHFTVPNTQLSMAIFGLFSGIVGGSTNAMSPILLIYLFSYTQNRNEISKISNLCYAMGKLVQIYFLWQQFTQFSQRDIISLIIITLISILFLFVGIKVRGKISQVVFKQLIYVVLLILAVKIGYSGIKAW
ncbi:MULTISPECIES: TSUP family transporter [unclassified Moraxella]|uniref:TSUP family transporter n=1 Tax=unclassified Moraxella TaxID=2685852 RepID=UPI003AF8F632